MSVADEVRKPEAKALLSHLPSTEVSPPRSALPVPVTWLSLINLSFVTGIRPNYELMREEEFISSLTIATYHLPEYLKVVN